MPVATPLRACNPAAVPQPHRFAHATRRLSRFHTASRTQPGGCAASTPLRACNPAAVPQPLRFAHATRLRAAWGRLESGRWCEQITSLYSPTRPAINWSRAGLSVYPGGGGQCRFYLLPRKARKLSTLQPDPPNHRLEPDGSFRLPGCCGEECGCLGIAVIAMFAQVSVARTNPNYPPMPVRVSNEI